MENLIFSLNAVLPVFLMMCFGYGLKRFGLIDRGLALGLNRFVFRAALPLMLFNNLESQDFRSAWNGKFVLFCMVTTLLSIGIVMVISGFAVKNRAERGEFVQASYRSSAAILGMAFIENIYGSNPGALGPLMILGSVPLYNIFAVTVLTMTAQEKGGRPDRELLAKTAKEIVTNPIILGIAVGFVWSLLKIPLHPVLSSAVQSVGRCATPLGLIAMGAMFDPKAVRMELKPIALASFIKLAGLTMLFLPAAVLLGFRQQELVALMVMLGSATTVSSYVMAVSMGHEGTLTSGAIMITTLGCSFTMTFWLFVLRSLALI